MNSRLPILRAILLSGLTATVAAGQMPADAQLLPRGTIMTGAFYSYDSWSQYWEGTLKRSNGNIGTLTTQSVMAVVGYGVTERLSVVATVPHIRTHASDGVLHDMSGIQDLTVSAKYRVAGMQSAAHGSVSAFVAATFATPLTHYTPDFLPLSIGTAGTRTAARATLGYQSPSWWFADASAAYTFCNNVRLDRGSYYTDGQLYLTNEVAMPNVMDYVVTAGVARGKLRLPIALVVQHTLGGGDIRRQDMPFVSNRMDLTRVEAGALYGLPMNVAVRAGASHVLTGRNVGQSTAFTAGLAYAFHL